MTKSGLQIMMEIAIISSDIQEVFLTLGLGLTLTDTATSSGAGPCERLPASFAIPPNAKKKTEQKKELFDFRRVRTCATEVTGALILRLRPLGQKVRYYDE